ncbi:MAG: cytochrome c oxidase assembly protein [Nocardioidaceae bacterium]
MDWLPDLVADQRLAGSITWAFSGLPGLAVIVVLLLQWSRSEPAAAANELHMRPPPVATPHGNLAADRRWAVSRAARRARP